MRLIRWGPPKLSWWGERFSPDKLPAPIVEPPIDRVEQAREHMAAAKLAFHLALKLQKDFQVEHGIHTDKFGVFLRCRYRETGATDRTRCEWDRLRMKTGRLQAQFCAATKAWSDLKAFDCRNQKVSAHV